MSASVSVELARFARSQIAGLGYVVNDDKSAPESLSGLKERIRQGSGDFLMLSRTRFAIRLPSASYYQAIRKDLFDGVIRIKSLQKSAICLVTKGGATAWSLTTCYYVSFFSAVEILRCSGTHISYFDEDLAALITQYAPTSAHGILESGTYEGSSIYDASADEVTITFSKRKIRHHEYTWSSLRRIVGQIRRNLTGVDGVMRERFEQFIGKDSRPSWPCPSETRNKWNYDNASLFGTLGESSGHEFRKLTLNPGAAYKWATVKRNNNTDSECASSVAFVMSVLVDTTHNLSAAILPDSLTKRGSFQKAMS
jgi:hypothetical protein